MRNRIFIYLLLLSAMFGLIGPASAETILLTKTNEPLPGGFVVTVITNTADNTMSVQLTSVPDDYKQIPLKSIDMVAYNLDSSVYGVPKIFHNGIEISNKWNFDIDANRAGFGSFISLININQNPEYGIVYPLIFKFISLPDAIPPNSLGNKVAVHLQFGDGTVVTILDEKDQPIDSTWITNTIPEFPTVALPIAAVIGLVFFFQHRKKKEE